MARVEEREGELGGCFGKGQMVHGRWLIFPANKGIYRHDAEGSDDMPVPLPPHNSKLQPPSHHPRISGRHLTPAGTHQILPHRRERLNTHHERQACAGHLARDMVLGVQGREA